VAGPFGNSNDFSFPQRACNILNSRGTIIFSRTLLRAVSYEEQTPNNRRRTKYYLRKSK